MVYDDHVNLCILIDSSFCSLSQNDLTSTGAIALGKALQHNKSLEQLKYVWKVIDLMKNALVGLINLELETSGWLNLVTVGTQACYYCQHTTLENAPNHLCETIRLVIYVFSDQ